MGIARRAALAVGTATLLTGCGGGAGSTVAVGSPQVTVPSSSTVPLPSPSPTPTCPAGTPTSLHWPAPVPAALPVPPTARLGSVTNQGNLVLIRFSTSRSVRDGVLFAVNQLPAAGFTLGRGDAETIEADVPFSKNGEQGLFRMIMQAPCQTQWILAVQRPGAMPGAPLLPSRRPVSPSPLPFGAPTG